MYLVRVLVATDGSLKTQVSLFNSFELISASMLIICVNHFPNGSMV